MSRWGDSAQQTLMVAEDVGFCNAKLKVEDIEVFTFDATNVTFAENASTERPVHILESGIIQVLTKGNERLKRKGEVEPMCLPWKLR